MQPFASALLGLCVLASAPALAADKADPLVKRHLEAKGTPYEVDQDNDYRIVVDLGDSGRTQQVYVLSDTNRVDGIAVREIWSTGYQALEKGMIPAKVANRLLEHSHTVILGSWVKQEDYGVFVIKIPADASADQLNSAIDSAATAADELELEFTGDLDEF